MHILVNWLLIGGIIGFAVVTTSDDYRWVEVGRVGFICSALMLALSVAFWSDPAATVDLPFDRQPGKLHIEASNPAGDNEFLCMTRRGIYRGGPCIGTKSTYWYRNVEDAKANAGRDLAKPVMMSSPRALR